MTKKIFLLGFLLMGVSKLGNCQFMYDTLYYQKQFDRPMISVYQQAYKYNLIISSNKPKEPIINYQAESLNEIGVTYSKNKFSVGLNLFGSPPLDEARKIKTRFFNLGATYCDKNYLKEFNLQWLRGFYVINHLRNPNQKSANPAFFQNPNLNIINIKYTGTRFTNYKHFSYNAVSRGLHKQNKTSSSFLYASQYAFQHINSKSIIPDSLKRFYDNYKELRASNNFSISGSIGYTVTLVLAKSFFINGYANIGIGLSDNILIFSDRPYVNLTQLTSQGGTKFSFGYHGPHWFIISSSNFDINFIEVKRISLNFQTLKNVLSAGYRF